jgi:Uma2 family endonuclease
MGEPKLAYQTIKEYLAQEEIAEFKSEYEDGSIRAMSGGSINHGLIGGSVYNAIRNQIDAKGLQCLPMNSDIRLFIDSASSFVYPDMSVVCGDVEVSEEDKNAYTNPILVVEVLSKSTGSYDRGDKFHKYCSLPSFKEYVLIDQYKPVVDVLYKEGSDYWKMVTTIGLDKSIYLHTLDTHISMQDIYQNARELQEPNF